MIFRLSYLQWNLLHQLQLYAHYKNSLWEWGEGEKLFYTIIKYLEQIGKVAGRQSLVALILIVGVYQVWAIEGAQASGHASLIGSG